MINIQVPVSTWRCLKYLILEIKPLLSLLLNYWAMLSSSATPPVPKTALQVQLIHKALAMRRGLQRDKNMSCAFLHHSNCMVGSWLPGEAGLLHLY